MYFLNKKITNFFTIENFCDCTKESHLAIINEQMHFANKSKKDFILHFIYLLIELLFTQFRSYDRYWRNS